MISVLIADDHGFIRAGVEAVLRGSRFTVVAGAASGEETLAAICESDPAIVLLDLNMPGMNGVHTLEKLRGQGDRRKVVLLTAEITDTDLVRVMDAGVDGVVLKVGAEDGLIEVLEAVHRGQRVIDVALRERAEEAVTRRLQEPILASTLSPRELELASLVARGLRNQDIGLAMRFTEATVKVYLNTIYRKLGISNRTELAMMVVGERLEAHPIGPPSRPRRATGT